MRFSGMSMGLATTLAVASARVAAAQNAVKLELTTSESQTVWYASPFWIGMGVLAVVLIIFFAAMAARRNTKTTTTVIR